MYGMFAHTSLMFNTYRSCNLPHLLNWYFATHFGPSPSELAVTGKRKSRRPSFDEAAERKGAMKGSDLGYLKSLHDP